MRAGQQLQKIKEKLRGSIWVLPTIAVSIALVAGLLLGQVETTPDAFWSPLVFDGGASAGRSLLEAIAGSLITVTSLTFSLMVVVLQNAASQYSPRLLRKFLRDLKNQTVLAVFLSTFAFAVVVLPRIRDNGDNGEEFVPQLAITLALILAIASIWALVLLIYNITQSIRVDAIMRSVRDDTVGTIMRNLPHLDDTATTDAPRPTPPPGTETSTLRAPSSGYIQSIQGEQLVDRLQEHDAVAVYLRSVGEQVVEGAPIALVWGREGGDVPTDDIEEGLGRQTQIGYERTMQEDVAFGIRQLTDIAVKALSPGINDPSTAVDALGRLSAIIRQLAEHQLGAELHHDEDGHLRVGVPRPRFSDYLLLVVEPISRYGEADLNVTTQLLRMLEDLGAVVHSEVRRRDILDAVDLVVARAHGAMDLLRSIERIDHGAGRARDAVGGNTKLEDVFVL